MEQFEGSLTTGDVLEAYAPISIGDAPHTNPTVGGTWHGALIEIDTSRRGDELRPRFEFVQGDVMLTIPDLLQPSINIAFSNLRNLNTGARIGLYGGALSWSGIMLSEGFFSDGYDSANSKKIQGGFYGPNHEEVGGTFEVFQYTAYAHGSGSINML